MSGGDTDERDAGAVLDDDVLRCSDDSGDNVGDDDDITAGGIDDNDDRDGSP